FRIPFLLFLAYISHQDITKILNNNTLRCSVVPTRFVHGYKTLVTGVRDSDDVNNYAVFGRKIVLAQENGIISRRCFTEIRRKREGEGGGGGGGGGGGDGSGSNSSGGGGAGGDGDGDGDSGGGGGGGGDGGCDAPLLPASSLLWPEMPLRGGGILLVPKKSAAVMATGRIESGSFPGSKVLRRSLFAKCLFYMYKRSITTIYSTTSNNLQNKTRSSIED
ncbi:hypothetical protein V1478_016191, partial [Vespula squamosa]